MAPPATTSMAPSLVTARTRLRLSFSVIIKFPIAVVSASRLLTLVDKAMEPTASRVRLVAVTRCPDAAEIAPPAFKLMFPLAVTTAGSEIAPPALRVMLPVTFTFASKVSALDSFRLIDPCTADASRVVILVSRSRALLVPARLEPALAVTSPAIKSTALSDASTS